MTVGSILGGMVRFIRANPIPVAIWGGIYFLASLLMRLGMAPFYVARAQETVAGLPPSFAHFGSLLLAISGLLLVLLVLNAAVFRAVLFPEQRRHAYLRVGGDELRLLGLGVVLFVALFLIEIVVVIAIGVVGGIIAAAMGLSRQSMALAGLGLMLLLLAALIYVTVRLSLAGPLTLVRREIAIGEAWRITRGRFWTLFGAYFTIWLGVLLVSLAFVLPTMGPVFAAMAHPNDPGAQAQIAALQARQMTLTSPAGIFLLVIGGLLGAVVLAVFGSVPAIATRQLIDERAGIA